MHHCRLQQLNFSKVSSNTQTQIFYITQTPNKKMSKISFQLHLFCTQHTHFYRFSSQIILKHFSQIVNFYKQSQFMRHIWGSINNGKWNNRIQNGSNRNQKWPPNFQHKIATNLNLHRKLHSHFWFWSFPFQIRLFRFSVLYRDPSHTSNFYFFVKLPNARKVETCYIKKYEFHIYYFHHNNQISHHFLFNQHSPFTLWNLK